MNIHEVQALEVKHSAKSRKSDWKLHCNLWLLQFAIWVTAEKVKECNVTYAGDQSNVRCLLQEHAVKCLWMVLHKNLCNEEIAKYLEGMDKQNFMIYSDNSQTGPTGNSFPGDCSWKLFASFQLLTSMSSWAPPPLLQRSDLWGFSYQHY